MSQSLPTGKNLNPPAQGKHLVIIQAESFLTRNGTPAARISTISTISATTAFRKAITASNPISPPVSKDSNPLHFSEVLVELCRY
jgi:hypothetical protein